MTREIGSGPSFVDRGLGEHRKTPPPVESVFVAQ